MGKHLLLIFLAGALLSAEEGGAKYHAYQKALLLKENGRVLKADDLEPNIPYFVQYPYKSTPTMLIRNEERDENNVSRYVLRGYLAINPNTYEYVNNDVTVASFYKNDIFGNDVIRFCDDKSSYAITTGANVLDSNVTNYPGLVNVKLREEGGKIYAVGVSDDRVISGMFKAKREALVKRFRSMWNAKVKYQKPRVLRIDRFSIVTVRCNDIMPIKPENNDSNESNLSVLIPVEK